MMVCTRHASWRESKRLEQMLARINALTLANNTQTHNARTHVIRHATLSGTGVPDNQITNAQAPALELHIIDVDTGVHACRMMLAWMHHPRACISWIDHLQRMHLLFEFDERSCTLVIPSGQMDGRMPVATRRLDTLANLETGQEQLGGWVVVRRNGRRARLRTHVHAHTRYTRPKWPFQPA
jgi:hypothetical protein